MLRALDRYVFREFWKIFISTALGFPVMVIVIDLTDNLDKWLNRNLTHKQIAMGYLYGLPDSIFLVLPAAVLFATVFSIGALTRHSEITAAKASGISFYRLVLPIFLGAILISVGALGLGEVVPITNRKRSAIFEERKYTSGTDRFNFAYAAERGRVYKVASLSTDRGAMEHLEIERHGKGRDYPTLLLTAASASWDSATARWTLRNGNLHILPDSSTDITVSYDSLHDHNLREAPVELMAAPRDPRDMRYQELGRFIVALERSGADANELKVERALKIAIPITCIIIAIFGAPLATSTQRGGAAFGIGVSLATTILFLMLIQITKAIGGGGVLPPLLAAWIPNVAFGVIGLVLLARTRT